MTIEGRHLLPLIRAINNVFARDRAAKHGMTICSP